MEPPIEYILSNFYKAEMIAYMEKNPGRIKELIKLALTIRPPYSWRAAWLLSSCVVGNESLIKEYIPEIINFLPEAKDGQKRDLINTVRKIDVGEEYEGKLFDICVDVWCHTSKIPSVRYNAFKFMVQMVEKYPELYNEVKILTQGHYMETLTPGIRRSLMKMLK